MLAVNKTTSLKHNIWLQWRERTSGGQRRRWPLFPNLSSSDAEGTVLTVRITGLKWRMCTVDTCLSSTRRLHIADRHWALTGLTGSQRAKRANSTGCDIQKNISNRLIHIPKALRVGSWFIRQKVILAKKSTLGVGQAIQRVFGLAVPTTRRVLKGISHSLSPSNTAIKTSWKISRPHIEGVSYGRVKRWQHESLYPTTPQKVTNWPSFVFN